MSNILNSEIKSINLGIDCFSEGISDQGNESLHVGWKPPLDAEAVEMIRDAEYNGKLKKVEEANKKAFQQLIDSEPYFTGIQPAIDVVPGMKENMVLHSGPYVDWDHMISTQKLGTIGAVLHEKLAKTREEAIGMIESGEILIESANDHFVVGAGAGIVCAHMPVNVSVDRTTGLKGFCPPFEGREGLAVWGVYNEEVEANLQIIENIFAPAINQAIEHGGDIDTRTLMAKGLQMGDELHTRQTGANLMLVNQIVPMLLDSGCDNETIMYCIKQFTSTERWFHPLCLSTCMAMIRGIKGMKNCSFVTSIAQNGIETGIKVAGLGEKWFKTEPPRFVGSYFSTEWGPDDAVPYMGDSTVSEVVGLGGFAAAAAPGVMRLRNGGYKEGIAQSEEMMEITYGINHKFPIPNLGFGGPGMGIDILKVVSKGITPFCHGGIISKQGGQIGAGGARFPSAHYIEAVKEFIRSIE